MANLRFAANLNFLFVKETSQLVERYMLAKKHGFRFVECGNPYVASVEDIQRAKREAGVEQILINTFPGEDFGFAARPDKVKDFKDTLETTIEYAKALDCKRVHVMSGCYEDRFSHDEMEATYIANIKFAADRLQSEGILALIEPINHYTRENYFMSSPTRAFKYIKQLGHPNLKLQLDIYHLQILEGNLTNNIEKYWSEVAHIQIAQTPNRTEPFLPGEINYNYIFEVLKKLKYNGYIGLEHKCTGDKTGDALGWIKELGYEM